MPLGQSNWDLGTIDPDRVIVPVSNRDQAPAPPSASERHVGDAAYFDHRTLLAGDTWPASISWGAPVHRLVIYAPLDVALVLSFDRGVSSAPGGYDAFHPGGGIAVIVARPHTTLRLATFDGGAPVPGAGSPSPRVEVTGHGGVYALRP